MKKQWFSISYFIFFIFVYLFHCNHSNLDKKEIHVDFYIQEQEKFFNFVRFVYIPNQNITFALFFNPEAIVDFQFPEESKNITQKDFQKWKNQTVQTRLEAFSHITGQKPDYYIFFNKESLIQFINFSEGVRLFLTHRLNLQKSKFYYLQGFYHFFGEKIYEYISLLEPYDRRNYHIASQERHFRFETFLLNFIHQLKKKQFLFENNNQFAYLSSMIDTNMQKENLKNFFQTLTRSQIIVIEFPLITQRSSTNDKPILFLNLPKSIQLYNSIRNQYNHIDKTSITLEVLNASNVNRLANRVKTIIHSNAFQVLAVDNFSFPLEKTILISNHGNGLQLDKLKQLLNISDEQIYFIRRTREVEFSFILGKDFTIKKLLKR